MGGFIAAVTSIATAASAVGSVVQAFKKPKQQSAPGPVQIAAPAVKEAEPSVDKAQQEAEEKIKKRRASMARNQTVFTSPLGLSETAKSQTSLKTLTGV